MKQYNSQPPPPNLLGEGPISLRNITKNGNRIFDMLSGLHNEIQFMDINHIKYDNHDSDWNPVSNRTMAIGKRMEDKLNGRKYEEDMYYDVQSIKTVDGPTDYMNYDGVIDVNQIPQQNYYETVRSPQIIPNYINNQNLENNRTMSKVDETDISEFIGGNQPPMSSFDNTIFINMDKTNKNILNNTTKICKLIGLLVQVENKNGKLLEEIKNRLGSHNLEDDYGMEDDENYTTEEE